MNYLHRVNVSRTRQSHHKDLLRAIRKARSLAVDQTCAVKNMVPVNGRLLGSSEYETNERAGESSKRLIGWSLSRTLRAFAW